MKEIKRNSLPGKYEGFAEKEYAGFTIKSQYVSGFDGTKLALDLVFPTCEDGSIAEGKFPVILLISRGGRMKKSPKRNGVDLIERCVPYGYVGAMLENRGAGASYGTQDSFASIENRKDVNAVIDWIIRQDWSDGQVAAVGGSNRGLIQFAAAVCRPEPSRGLKGITPIVCDPDFYYQDYPNGVSAIPLHRKNNVSGSAVSPTKKTKEEVLADPQVEPVDEDPNGDMAYEAYLTGQYGRNRRFMESLLLENMCRDDENPNFGGEKTNITIPPITDIEVFKKTDIQIHQFAGLCESGTFGQLMASKEWGGTMVLGPWTHRQCTRTTADTIYPEGAFDMLAEHHKWLDNLLKGVDNGFDKRPPYVYYMIGAEEGRRWRFSDTWPVENERRTVFYLTADRSGTCGSQNDGSLSLEKPGDSQTTDYKVDTSIEVFDSGEGSTFERMALTWDGDMTPGVDNKGLTFTSLPLYGRYRNEMAGSVGVDLWVTCDQPDADFIVYLEEVLKSGESRYVSMGMLRASHRTTAPRAAWNEAGVCYHPCMRADMEKCLAEGMKNPTHLQFAIEPAVRHFAEGSRLRLTITCANKKAFQHPMYREEDLPTVTLYQGGDHASFIRVPFIEHEENVYKGQVETEGYQGPGTLYFFKDHLYLYYNGCWKKMDAGSPEAGYEMENGKAVFGAGFSFTMEGRPAEDGAICDYQGGEPAVIPLPYRRRRVVDTVSVAAHGRLLFLPAVKTLYVEEYRMDSREEKAPAVLYMHGYSGTPSRLTNIQLELLRRGYAVIGVDMRNYPPNCFPDYVYDIKGCIRYVRAHAAELKVDPDRLGGSGQSMGGNAVLIAAASAGEAELEGCVGGNAGVSSRLQAVCVGYGWSDILHMGLDLEEEYKDCPEEIRKMKFDNSDGPKAPLGEVIGFAGEGKGIKVLRDYMEQGREGTDPVLDEMLRKAILASPVSHIGPDFPPAALFSGLGMVRVDIPDRQSRRTFEACSRYGADCFLFANTNGSYGQTAPVVNAVCSFFDTYLRGKLPHKKTVASPGSRRILENFKDRDLGYPLFAEKNGEIYAAAEYLEAFQGKPLELETAEIGGRKYVKAENLKGTDIGYQYYPDKKLGVLVPAAVWAGNQPKNRTY
ncbi:MAG TPA: CocE/NonD family hydrolase [Candidatus Lachnoclostridium pullistercoris]|uniref:CocE/NonD family hydrolase n=1 Tax=Candidatus Lachnoclostridium pullistercoris TaxID=2838632 RepID=A0A9D2PBG5_9FIRM|nr:CocE/NonD family hydrolase [Candidatus Lachnoclostridium pullistercoris]